MLRPGFSLVGLEALVMPTFPNAPEGCATIQIDWEGAGYTDDQKWGDLPPFLNVPIAHLEPVETQVETQNARPVLGLVDSEGATSREEDESPIETAPTSPQNSSKKPDSSHDSDDERPRLRLI